MNDPQNVLCFAGALLFLLGLLVGFAIPVFRASRLGLSAHLTGLQSGTALIVFGLLWPRIGLWPAWSGAIAHGLWLSLYAIFASLVMAAAFGAGQGLPIAGGGITTTRGKQIATSFLLIGGSLACAVFVAAVLIGWHWQAG